MANQFTDVVWPGWEVVRKLGEGSFGGVYEIQRTLPDGQVEKGALKKLTLPRNADEIEELRSGQYDEASITAHFSNQLKNLVGEYGMMKKLSGCPNIVHSLDLSYIQHDDAIGWDLYIRMELLTPLKKVLPPEYSEKTVLELGKSLCNALVACEKEHIIHRDIKPENILVSDAGVYKLGDFGVAKVAVENGTGTITGTTGYMAPEIAKHEAYGPTVDIYSLGMVLYWMMNERTLPFLPLPPQIPSPKQRQDATNCRFRGEALPEPTNGSGALKAVVLKACAYRPEERYQTAEEMLHALKDCADKRKTTNKPEPIARNPVAETPKKALDTPQKESQEELQKEQPEKMPKHRQTAAKRRNSQKALAVVAAAAVCVFCAALLLKPKRAETKPDTATVPVTTTQPTVEELKADSQEPVVKLTLTPDEAESFADVQHDGPLIQDRLRVLSPTAEITTDEKTGVIEAAIPIADIGYENNIESIIKTVVSRPLEAYFVKYVSSFQFYADDTEGHILREDIAKARAVTAGEMQEKYGLPEIVEATNGQELTLEKELPCLYLKLTENGAQRIHDLDDVDGKLTIGMDVKMSNPVTFPYLFEAPDGESYVLVMGEKVDGNAADALAAALTQETLHQGYYFAYTIEPEARWETESAADAWGEKQCEYEDLPDIDNSVAISMEIYNYDDVSEENRAEAIRQVKDKLDIIGMPYAFGRDVQKDNWLVVRTSPERLHAKLLAYIAGGDWISLRTSNTDIYAYLEVQEASIVPVGGNGAIGLQLLFKNPDELEKLSSKLRWKDDKSIWVGSYGEAVLSTEITTTITDGTLILDQLPMLNMDTIPEEYRYLLEFFSYCMRQDHSHASVYLRGHQFKSEQGHFGLSSITPEDRKTLDRIGEAYPDVKSWIEEDSSKTLKIQLNVPIGSDFLKTCFDQVEDIFKKCDLDNGDMEYVVVYLINEKGNQRCRLTFVRDGDKPYLACVGNCKGDILDGYRDEFEKLASWRLFFQKRNFQMYSDLGI